MFTERALKQFKCKQTKQTKLDIKNYPQFFLIGKKSKLINN